MLLLLSIAASGAAAQEPVGPIHIDVAVIRDTSAADSTPTIGVRALVDAAIEANPDLAALRREFDAARARIPQAKALPDPMLSVGNITVGNPAPFAGFGDDFSEVSVGVSQDVPWFGIRRLRGEAALSDADAELEVYRAAERQRAFEVKAAAFELYAIDWKQAVLRRDIDILDKFAKVAEARYSTGKAQQVDVINARLEITELLNTQGELEAERSTVEATLNALMFRAPERKLPAIARPVAVAKPPGLEDLYALAEDGSPELREQRRRIDASNHRLRLAERQAKFPEVGFNFSYHNRPGFGDFYAYGVTFKLPIYAASKQRYGIEEGSANLEASRSRLMSMEALVRRALREAHVRATTATRLLKLHEQGLVPQATLALESALSAYQVGQVDFQTVLTALRKALNYETHYYELQAEYFTALARIEAVTGLELMR